MRAQIKDLVIAEMRASPPEIFPITMYIEKLDEMTDVLEIIAKGLLKKMKRRNKKGEERLDFLMRARARKKRS